MFFEMAQSGVCLSLLYPDTRFDANVQIRVTSSFMSGGVIGVVLVGGRGEEIRIID